MGTQESKFGLLKNESIFGDQGLERKIGCSCQSVIVDLYGWLFSGAVNEKMSYVEISHLVRGEAVTPHNASFQQNKSLSIIGF